MRVLVLLQLLVSFGIMDNSIVVKAETGFVSFMCGASSDYFSESDGISWTSDAAYAPPISKAISLSSQASLLTLRVFPHDASSPSGRSCYSNIVPSGLILVRATFAYGNYDSLNKPPVFGVSIGATMYSTINLSLQDPWVEEIIMNADQGQAFCLIAMDGIPVISLLELRPLPPRSYNRASSSLAVALKKVYRIDCGSDAMKITRYPDDSYDRIWDPDQYYLDGSTTSTHSISRQLKTSAVTDDCPMIVLQSNRFNYHNQTLSYSLPLTKPNGKYLMNAFFGELYNTTGPSFIVTVNGAVLTTVVGWAPLSSAEFTATQAASSWWNISLLPVTGAPQINGLEVYEIVQLMHVSNQRDARALNLIELNFNIQNILLDWALGSDPCFPVPWRGVICSTGGVVTSLDLSNSQLSGDVAGLFQDFTGLESLNASSNNLVGHVQNLTGRFQVLRVLDLSNNQLSGNLDVFATLNLHYLNIANNQFSGPIPERLTQPGLVVITSGNPCIQYDSTDPCKPSLNGSIVPQSVERNTIGGSEHYSKSVITGVVIGISVAMLAIAVAGFTGCRRYKLKRELIDAFQEAGTVNILEKELTRDKNAKRFSFLELENATNRFKHILGEGNLGPVYRGRLQDGTDVAIKMRADGLQHDADSFLKEVSLLSKLRHQNIVLLIGFCLECKNQLLVFEFMSGGSLKDHLYGPLSKIQPMSWEQRLTSVIGAANGLEYLHRGCESKIIHRNVKSSNILLGPNYFAKVADFCLSKRANHDEKSPIGGTAGYLDPEYFDTSQLTDKSDVFSFGVVLMEILCGREPLSSDSAPDAYNLVAWVRPALQDDIPKGDTSVVDKGLRNQFVLQSLIIVANVALQCTEKEGVNRPSMTQVVRELRRAADIELLLPTDNNDSTPHQSLQSTSQQKIKSHHSAELYPSRSKSISQIR